MRPRRTRLCEQGRRARPGARAAAAAAAVAAAVAATVAAVAGRSWCAVRTHGAEVCVREACTPEACAGVSRGRGGCAMLGRKLQSPEEPAPPPQPPTRCTESFDGLRPRVGGADLGWVPAAPRPWVARADQDLRPHGRILTARWLTLLRAGSMMSGSRDLSHSVWQPPLETGIPLTPFVDFARRESALAGSQLSPQPRFPTWSLQAFCTSAGELVCCVPYL